MAGRIDRHRALAWPAAPDSGDTVWLGVVDGRRPRRQRDPKRLFRIRLGAGPAADRLTWQNRGSEFLPWPPRPSTRCSRVADRSTR